MITTAQAVASDARITLADGSKTRYRIVIPADAAAGERMAADELQHFLGSITGARFPVIGDDTAHSGPEIVLGATDRFDQDDIPSTLVPATDEGFAIFPREEDLIIIGNIPRATLYGVYDFLEQELGVRFLAPGGTYVPQDSNLSVEIGPRCYDPPLEYRNIYDDPQWSVRNRLNGTWSWVPMEQKLGGVRFIGPSFVHTFKHLVDPDEHFDEHPEYFALVDGERRRTAPGGRRPAQLCLTNPQVLELAIEAVQDWVKQYREGEHYHPDTLMIASISPNDAGGHCQCPECRAVNEKEGSPAGTLIRFVNNVARALEDDYPTLAIETLAYGATETPPKITRARSNVIVRLAPIGADFGKPLDDPNSRRNRSIYQNLKAWSSICDRLYIWNYYCNFHAYFKPFPNLEHIDRDIRTYRRHGMRGLYAQSSQTPGSELRALRHYLIARCMWRPETDGDEAMEEFCHLYYGQGASGVLKYVDYLHSYYRRQNVPLLWNDASRADGVSYDSKFIRQANEILQKAENAARLSSRKHRVAKLRLSIWYLMIRRALSEAARGVMPASDALEAAQRFLEVSQEVGVTHMSEFYGPAGQQLEQDFYPRLRALLGLGANETAAPDAGVVRGVTAFFGNPHRTYSVTQEEGALSGYCVCQTADRRWTLLQAVRWGLTDHLREASQTGQRYELRVRVKVDKKGDDGTAFRFGHMSMNADFSATICSAITVNCRDVEDGQWCWYTLPEPAEYTPGERGQNAFVVAADNPENVDRVCVDVFELVPADESGK